VFGNAGVVSLFHPVSIKSRYVPLCLIFKNSVVIPCLSITGNDSFKPLSESLYRGADKSLARPGRKQATATEDFDFHIILFIIIIGGIYIYNMTTVK